MPAKKKAATATAHEVASRTIPFEIADLDELSHVRQDIDDASFFLEMIHPLQIGSSALWQKRAEALVEVAAARLSRAQEALRRECDSLSRRFGAVRLGAVRKLARKRR